MSKFMKKGILVCNSRKVNTLSILTTKYEILVGSFWWSLAAVAGRMMHGAQAAMKGRCCLLTSRQILQWLQEGRRQITQGAWPQTRPRLLRETRKLVCKNQGAVWAELRKMDFIHSSKDHVENARRINPSGLRVQAVSLFLCRMGPDLCWVPRKSLGRVASLFDYHCSH